MGHLITCLGKKSPVHGFLEAQVYTCCDRTAWAPKSRWRKAIWREFISSEEVIEFQMSVFFTSLQSTLGLSVLILYLSQITDFTLFSSYHIYVKPLRNQ
jgi:hypothetical protein